MDRVYHLHRQILEAEQTRGPAPTHGEQAGPWASQLRAQSGHAASAALAGVRVQGPSTVGSCFLSPFQPLGRFHSLVAGSQNLQGRCSGADPGGGCGAWGGKVRAAARSPWLRTGPCGRRKVWAEWRVCSSFGATWVWRPGSRGVLGSPVQTGRGCGPLPGGHCGGRTGGGSPDAGCGKHFEVWGALRGES